MIFPIYFFLAAEIIVILLSIISDIFSLKSEPFVKRNILLNSYNYIQKLSYSFFQENSAGYITSKIKGLVEAHDIIWQNIKSALFLRISSVFIGISSLFLINIYVGFAIITWVLSSVFINYLFIGKLSSTAKTENLQKHNIISIINDNINNILSIFSHSSRKKERI